MKGDSRPAGRGEGGEEIWHCHNVISHAVIMVAMFAKWSKQEQPAAMTFQPTAVPILPVRSETLGLCQCRDTPLLSLQVNPFASAFRPVLPSKRDSNSLNRSPLSPSQVSASQVSPAFQPGSSPPVDNPALQAQRSASSVQLSEAPQSADSVDRTASAATANGAS